MPFMMSAVTRCGTYTSSPTRAIIQITVYVPQFASPILNLKVFSGLFSRSYTCHTRAKTSSVCVFDHPKPVATVFSGTRRCVGSLTVANVGRFKLALDVLLQMQLQLCKGFTGSFVRLCSSRRLFQQLQRTTLKQRRADARSNLHHRKHACLCSSARLHRHQADSFDLAVKPAPLNERLSALGLCCGITIRLIAAAPSRCGRTLAFASHRVHHSCRLVLSEGPSGQLV